MSVTIDLINASKVNIPAVADFQEWAQSTMLALPENQQDYELSIRIIDTEESAYLNENFRLKQGPTNILSFPCDQNIISDVNLLGDLAICAQVVIAEAQQQDKSLLSHWAHMTVHGVLHLNAFDHEIQAEADTMEQLEISILKSLGYDNPYQEH